MRPRTFMPPHSRTGQKDEKSAHANLHIEPYRSKLAHETFYSTSM